jgi:hypothetical protein
MNGFRYALKPFKYWCRDEYKYFLELSNPNSSCNHITLGVGGSWNGEKALRRKYPQCRMLGKYYELSAKNLLLPGVDSIKYKSKAIVESDPNSRFVQALLVDEKTGEQFRKGGMIFIRAESKFGLFLEYNSGKWKGMKKPVMKRGLSRLLITENEGRVSFFKIKYFFFVILKNRGLLRFLTH